MQYNSYTIYKARVVINIRNLNKIINLIYTLHYYRLIL